MADTPSETETVKTSVIEACRKGKLQVVQAHLQKGGGINELLVTGQGRERSLLMIASQCGHLNMVSYLLKFGASPNLQTSKGGCALMLASQNGHPEVVKLLHEFGAQVDLQEETGWTALMLASQNGHSEVVKLLHEFGAQVDLQEETGWSALMLASQNGHSEVVKLLSNFGAEVNLQEEVGWSPLMLASQGGHSKVVKLLHGYGAQVDLQEKNGCSALMLAVKNGHSEVVKLLYEFSAQVDLQEKNGWSALMIASKNGNSEIVKLLHKFSAQVDLEEKKGWSALMMASQKGHSDVVKLLLEFGAQVDKQSKSGRTALMLASQKGYSEVVKLLCDFGAQVDRQSKHGWSALMIASENGHSEVVKLLHQFGSQVDLQSNNGTSGLVIASQKGHSNVVKLLYELGAQVDKQSKSGRTALMLASQKGYSEIVKLLCDFGAQVDRQSKHGWSALMIASKNGHFEVVKLLHEFGAQVHQQNKNGMTALMIAVHNKQLKVVRLLRQLGAANPKVLHAYKSGLLPVASASELSTYKEGRLFAPKKLPVGIMLSENIIAFRALATTDLQHSDHDRYSTQDLKKAQPPVIVTHPADQVLEHYGGKVTLSITTQFGDKFEWFKDGEKIAFDVHPQCSNYDSPDLVISPFMPEYEGRYKCRVSNKAGYIESTDAELSTAFLRELLFCRQDINEEGGIIKGEGIELFFPGNTLPPGESTTINILASVDGPTKHSGMFSVSPIFRVKCEPYREFQNEVQVTIEHFTKLEVEEDIDNLVFMVSRKDEEEFYPAAGNVTTELGSRYGTVKVNHFSRFGFWKRGEPKYSYSMLVALPVNPCTVEGFVWAFFSITVDSSTYTKIFQDYLGLFKDHPFHPIEQKSIESLQEVVELTIPQESDIKPYSIHPSFIPPSIKKKDVNSKSRNSAVYPPRVRLDIALSEQPRTPLSCYIQLSGIKDFNSFALKAVVSKEISAESHTRSRDVPKNENHPVSQSEDVDTIECDSSHHATLYEQLSLHAAKWREIGTHLGFRQGELDNIESKPTLLLEAPRSWLRVMLSEWLEWVQGEGRGRATLRQLKDAVRKCGRELGQTAEKLHIL